MKFFLFILPLVSVTVYSQTYSRVVSDKEITDFIQWDLSKDSIAGKRRVYRKIIPFQKTDFILKDSAEKKWVEYSLSGYLFKKKNYTDSLFSVDDIDFLIEQADKTINASWEFDWPNVSLKDTLALHPKNTIFSYSLPLFSVDRNKVIIIKAFYCGLVCGGGAYYIYKRRSAGEWELMKAINEWAE